MEYRSPQPLGEGATVAIVGGGPAGSFTALHLLKQARRKKLRLKVLIFERRLALRNTQLRYRGCPQCAGGVSPRLCDALHALDIQLPPGVVQLSIDTITLQGRWKNLHLSVPPDRKMLSVYRGTLPHDHDPEHHASKHQSFDALLLDHAENRGAKVIGGLVEDVTRDPSGRPVLTIGDQRFGYRVTADFLVFATGINDSPSMHARHMTGRELFVRLCSRYRPPGLRKALIFELDGPRDEVDLREGELHYVECTEAGLQLEMCSILPKREFLTVSLIGRSVDQAKSHSDKRLRSRRFLF